MIDKVKIESYSAKSSKLVRRKCPQCKKSAMAELVDYGKGGILLFCECGNVRDATKVAAAARKEK